jgi:hypothetical protein
VTSDLILDNPGSSNIWLLSGQDVYLIDPTNFGNVAMTFTAGPPGLLPVVAVATIPSEEIWIMYNDNQFKKIKRVSGSFTV